MFSAADHTFMSHALQLAEKGLYSTTPNPRVGCVIVQNEHIIASGWHKKSGHPHAEIYALKMAGEAARDATAYVTLEPCNHYGLTPPCARALIEAGIAKVNIAMEDPNPIVAGRGRVLLQQAGITVTTGLLEAQAQALNIGFVSRMTRKKPWVRLKIATSLDGKIALRNGASQWITGEAARIDAHRWRARSCAIMTGIGTVKSDNPQLTVRHVETTRQPKKIVLDSQLSIPLSTSLLRDESVIIFTTNRQNQGKISQLTQLGVQVILMPANNGMVDLEKMLTLLATDFAMNEILVEAGSHLNGALLNANLVDEIILYIAPHLLGDDAQDIFRLPGLVDLKQKKTLIFEDIRTIGQDIRIIARPVATGVQVV
ncbi:diaminohydroxyphosphoribosylaminopyrimidine deaminase [Nitrosomonas sp. PY1]|uniref:bifunctional diaminohydroxyphosphoribosylaminopyrimidine deaminase/5-amino-6-(5-phosphoribosylamino)uracil reductase RibD n=1 Tax=Nitrosomonas sp. PY1 TaxID=1803906 RepID=UPI001FC83FBB|nr:bifunctional diaminohydroxyphosphoribosylaminopyrimidine deaminase/5-amino-6-(5-phosphoribosylamino)uracil reductase RibD [Nitrosomonas sp. PY1]GKS69984.1 diaminohydroxyphosphoribosylaminopyrimidine deaminase [Nitrosomonas sp. PY1]